jgi:predicted DNA-binding protein with PD1-like motif
VEDLLKFKQVNETPKTFVLVFQTGDELASGLAKFSEQQKLSAASLTAVGAFSDVRLAYFNWETKKYEISVSLGEQVELLSLIGDVALKDDKPVVHAHAVIGRKDGTTCGGHLLEAHIRPTCEVVITESPADLQKFVDPESGLALIRL